MYDFPTGKNYYDLLEISQDASEEDIRQAYRRLAREWHPDVSSASDAVQRFQDINEAYEVLSDPTKRQAYDSFSASLQAKVLHLSQTQIRLGFLTKYLFDIEDLQPVISEITVDADPDQQWPSDPFQIQWQDYGDQHPWASYTAVMRDDYDPDTGDNTFPFTLQITVDPNNGDMGLNQATLVIRWGDETHNILVEWKLPGLQDKQQLLKVTMASIWKQYIRLGRSLDLSFKNLDGLVFQEKRELPEKLIRMMIQLRAHVAKWVSFVTDSKPDQEDDAETKLRSRYGDPKKFSLKQVLIVGSSLVGTSLRHQDMQQANLFNSDLSQADMLGSDLSNANLNRVTAVGLKCDQVIFRKGKLKKINLSQAEGVNTIFLEADLSEGILEHAVLPKANLGKADLTEVRAAGINLSEARLVEAKLVDTDFRGANLEKANLKGAMLRQVNLFQANLEQAQWVNQGEPDNNPQTVMENIIFDEALMAGVCLAKQSLEGCSFKGTDLRNANLSGCSLRGFNLAGANLAGANLTEADLTEANLEKADLSGALLPRSCLHKANLRSANLTNAIFTAEANLSGADLRQAELVNLNLVGADLQETQLEGANLLGSDLWGVSMYGASYSSTTIWPEGLDSRFTAAVLNQAS